MALSDSEVSEQSSLDDGKDKENMEPESEPEDKENIEPEPNPNLGRPGFVDPVPLGKRKKKIVPKKEPVEEDKVEFAPTFIYIFLMSFLASGILYSFYVYQTGDAGLFPNFGPIHHLPAKYLPDSVNNWFKSWHIKETTPATNKDSKGFKNKNYDFLKGPSKSKRLRMFTDSEIKYVDGGKLLLILIGHVFDVSDGGQEYYKPGTGYHGFIGRDSSRAFVSGEFGEEGLVSNLDGLEPNDYKGLIDWLKFYVTHEKYKFVGYHIGRYYNEDRTETDEMGKLRGWIKKGMEDLDKEGDLLKLFPTCNVQWKKETGSEVWCSNKSGGVDRDWVGFPRQFFEPGKQARCSCVHPNYLADPRVKEYEGCASTSITCKIIETAKEEL